jgi:hypothetical protein
LINSRAARFVAVVFILLLGFQNCGKGFQAAKAKTDSSESARTAEGQILPFDPYQDSGNPALPFTTDFTSYMKKAVLTDLDFSANFLSNGQVELDVNGAFPNDLTKPADKLDYAESDHHFYQVNAYYHVDGFLNHVKSTGIMPAQYPLVHVDSNCTQIQNNAYFDPTTRTVCLGSAKIGSFDAWASADADVIVHEFGHSINHSTSTDDILSSSTDTEFLDEGFADLWAYFRNGQAHFGTWFGKALYTALGLDLTGFAGLRDLTTIPKYPDNLVGEMHVDSPTISTVYYELQQDGVASDTLLKLMSHVLTDLQAGDSLDIIVGYVQQEATALGISSAQVTAALNRRNLLRKDNPSMLSIPSGKIFVIDNHLFTGQSSNCNGQLDANETAAVFIDLSNAGPSLGYTFVQYSMVTQTTDVTIVTGGDTGAYSAIKNGLTYLNSLPAIQLPPTDGQSLWHVIAPTMIVQAGANAGGKTYNFQVKIYGYDTNDMTPFTATLPFSLTVGTAAVQTANCPGNGEDAVWPKR